MSEPRRLVRLLLVVALVGGAALTSAASAGAEQPASYLVGEQPPNFPDTPVGEPATERRAVTLRNGGTAPLTVTAITEQDPSGSFTVGQECVGSRIDPGPTGGCVLSALFLPSTAGLLQVDVLVSHTGTGSPTTYTFRGTGTTPPPPPPPVLGHLVTNYGGQSTGVGEIVVGESSAPRVFPLINAGDGPLTITSITENDIHDGFTVTDACVGVTIQPGASCIGVTVVFVPTAPGLQAVTVDVQHTGDNPGILFGIYGTGVAAPPPPPRPNRAPTVSNQEFATDEDTTLDVVAPGLLAVASDPDDDALTIALANPPAIGDVDVASDGGFRYVPAPDAAGTDTFTVTVDDGRGGSATATVTIDVIAAPLVATKLRADTIGLHLSGLRLVLAPGATLTDDAGTPLPGRMLSFRLPDGTALCSVTSDPRGHASCAVSVPRLVSILLAGARYQVTYAGGPDHQSARAMGSVRVI